MMTVSDVLLALEEKAPCGLKLDFDNVGHLVGHGDASVTRVMTALDITDDVIAEAAEWGAELIVSHHPLIFSPVTKPGAYLLLNLFIARSAPSVM